MQEWLSQRVARFVPPTSTAQGLGICVAIAVVGIALVTLVGEPGWSGLPIAAALAFAVLSPRKPRRDRG